MQLTWGGRLRASTNLRSPRKYSIRKGWNCITLSDRVSYNFVFESAIATFGLWLVRRTNYFPIRYGFQCLRAALSLIPGDCLDSFSLRSLPAYAQGRSMWSNPICERHVPKCDSEASQVTMNSKSKLTGAKHGLEIILFFRFRNDCFAAPGNGPLV